MTAWEAWKETFEERAAIREYLGGYSREQAEHLARQDAGPEPERPKDKR